MEYKKKKRRLSSANIIDNDEESDNKSTFTFKKGNVFEQKEKKEKEEKGKRRWSAKKVNNAMFDKLSESVLNFTKCFICLSPAIDPLTCPECNNFACKECLNKYYGSSDYKQCPLCKQDIEKTNLKENTIINEIENIIYNESNNKIKELSDLLNEKKKDIEENTNNNVNVKIEKLIKYQERMQKFRKMYYKFLDNWKKLIVDVFDKYDKKIKELLDYYLEYNENIKQAITSYNKIDKKNKKNYYGPKNISSLINEILILERKLFNDTKNEKDKNFLSDEITPITVKPNISSYSIISLKIEKKDFKDFIITNKGYNVFIGNFTIKLSQKHLSYKAQCEFEFFMKNDYNAAFFVLQRKLIGSKCEDVIPMKLKYCQGTNYNYEVEVDFEDFMKGKENIITLETKIQIFYVS
jgi:hypothetical protein